MWSGATRYAVSMDVQQNLPLSEPVSSDNVVVNGRGVLRREGNQRVVVIAGLPVHHYSAEDETAEAYAIVLSVALEIRSILALRGSGDEALGFVA